MESWNRGVRGGTGDLEVGSLEWGVRSGEWEWGLGNADKGLGISWTLELN